MRITHRADDETRFNQLTAREQNMNQESSFHSRQEDKFKLWAQHFMISNLEGKLGLTVLVLTVFILHLKFPMKHHLFPLF